MAHAGPFRPGTVAAGVEFTNRADEVRRIADTLATPGARLLVIGPRRMGKTSAILAAAGRVERKHGAAVLLADLSTATVLADAANRLLEAAARSLGRRWKDVVQSLIERLGIRLTLAPDPSGLLLPAVDVSLRSASAEEQGDVFGRVLDTLDALAGERKMVVGVVIDEFQELSRIGGETAEWQLRGRMQRHHNLSYVLSGSQAHLIERMLEQKRAFYGMLTPMSMGPIDSEHMARWIETRLEKEDIRAKRVGDAICRLAGPRTQDIVRLARRTYELALRTGAAAEHDIELAFATIIDEEAPLVLRLWEGLTALQQNVLRAVSAADSGLTTRETLTRFSLASSGSAANAAASLVDSEVLTRAPSPAGYVFDSPFVRGWVVRKTLPDIGLLLPPTHLVDPLR